MIMDESDIAKACIEEKTNANKCIQTAQSAACSSCYEDTITFEETFAIDLKKEFLDITYSYSATTEASSDQQQLCDFVNIQICDYFAQHNSCCCVGLVQRYRKCLMDTVLIPAVMISQLQPDEVASTATTTTGHQHQQCNDTCDYLTHNHMAIQLSEDPTESINNWNLIIGAAIGGIVMLALGISIYRFLSNRNNDRINKQNEEGKRSKKEDTSTKNGDVESNFAPQLSSGDDDVEQQQKLESPEHFLESSAEDDMSDISGSSSSEYEATIEQPVIRKGRGDSYGDQTQALSFSSVEDGEEEAIKVQPKRTRSKAAAMEAAEDYVQVVSSIEKLIGYNENIERIKEKKRKIKEWRQLKREGSDESLLDYLSDEQDLKAQY